MMQFLKTQLPWPICRMNVIASWWTSEMILLQIYMISKRNIIHPHSNKTFLHQCKIFLLNVNSQLLISNFQAHKLRIYFNRGKYFFSEVIWKPLPWSTHKQNWGTCITCHSEKQSVWDKRIVEHRNQHKISGTGNSQVIRHYWIQINIKLIIYAEHWIIDVKQQETKAQDLWSLY